VKSKMATAATGPCCLNFDIDSLDEDAMFGGCNLAIRMIRLDNFKLRIRKGNAADTIAKKGPMVSVK